MKNTGILKGLILILPLLFALFTPSTSLADPRVIRIAILDNVNDPYLPSGYQDSYIAGIKTAALVAQNQGYTIQYQTFFYDNNPLAILKEVPSVTAWHPDLIIGPHSSNQLLLLRNSFKNIMILSPYASDSDIASLPDNFYSLALLDKDLGHTVVKFLSSQFPNRGLINVVAADCKDCVDLTDKINSGYQSLYPSAKIVNNMYSGDSGSVSVNELIASYQKGDVILLQPNTSPEIQPLIYRIAAQLGDSPIFINNLDNVGSFGKMPKNIHYVEYWLTVDLFDPNSPDFQAFSKYYQQLYGNSDYNSVSYSIYITAMSAIKALKAYPSSAPTMQANILNSYKSARQANPHWYKTSNYAIYKIDPQGTTLIGTISAFD
ncbi:MAG: hypothetical protein K0R66_1084 [Gammaproteobacteria bacterium]|jgi:ABC-type branched-subunit amino acid transport system substrate-binding protein|nr:hypothetical protein [Gammaproteobacteria bacterium]